MYLFSIGLPYILIKLSPFPLTFLQTRREYPFHQITFDYSSSDCDGLCDHLSDVQGRNFYNLDVSGAASMFLSGFRL